MKNIHISSAQGGDFHSVHALFTALCTEDSTLGFLFPTPEKQEMFVKNAILGSEVAESASNPYRLQTIKAMDISTGKLIAFATTMEIGGPGWDIHKDRAQADAEKFRSRESRLKGLVDQRVENWIVDTIRRYVAKPAMFLLLCGFTPEESWQKDKASLMENMLEQANREGRPYFTIPTDDSQALFLQRGFTEFEENSILKTSKKIQNLPRDYALIPMMREGPGPSI